MSLAAWLLFFTVYYSIVSKGVEGGKEFIYFQF